MEGGRRERKGLRGEIPCKQQSLQSVLSPYCVPTMHQTIHITRSKSDMVLPSGSLCSCREPGDVLVISEKWITGSRDGRQA